MVEAADPAVYGDTVLIIGAGPVGLAVSKAFGEAGIPRLTLEATDHVGGNWAHGVYHSAHIISSRRTTEYADHPMPSDWPDFPSAAQMCAYYEEYARVYGLGEHIRFQQEVRSVRPRADGLWEVQAGEQTSVFKAVVVCNGHHWSRSFPAWVNDFSGTVLHSKDYKRPEELAHRRVLVLGGGNSGCDIVSEAARVSDSADWSLRRGYWFLPKTWFGRPTVELVRPWMPIAVQRRLVRALLRVTVGRYADYGLPEPDHEIFEAHPTVSTEVFHYLTHGRIRPRPDVVGCVGDEVTFADGSHHRYDVVVCATGFDLSFPFLAPGTVPVVGKVAQLYGGMMRPEFRHLYVMGTTQPRYGLGPLVRPGAQLLAQLVNLQDELRTPLGAVLQALGDRPPITHLQDPHAVLRQIRRGQRLLPLLRWRGRLMDSRRPTAPSAPERHPSPG